ncbi:MAG: S8 family serine peptidase [Parcubacteria group bacterium]|nr:S8 family serine peptidase [Parcubacteria group bacterium]
MRSLRTKTKVLAVMFVVAALLAGTTGSLFATQTAHASSRVNVFIGFTQTPGASEQALVRAFGGEISHSYHLVPAIAASVPESAVNGLLKNPRVAYVEADGIVYAIDAELDNTWGVKRIGSGTVHDNGNKGVGVKVAIIDSGIDYTHPDLDANFGGGYDFVNNDTDSMDDNGHGTHVAGTVAAEDNDTGVVGVAPEASLYGLKVLNSSGSGSWSNVVAALQWAVDNGIQVTNNSYGAGSDPGSTVKAAFDNSAAVGIYHAAAAGNSGNCKGNNDTVGYPARYDSVIAVAATNKSDSRPCFSSTGPAVELSAPGVSINSTQLGGGYVEFSGTSMASPHVAGVAALVIAAGIADSNGNGLINDEIRQVLNDTAEDLGDTGRDNKYGWGLVSAAAAVAAVGPVEPPAIGTISGTVTDADTTNPIAGATVTDGTRSTTTDTNGNYSIADVPEGTYRVNASADGYNNASETNVSVTADTTTTVDFALTAVVYGTIDGTVTDETTGVVIEGATVTDGTRQATTDSTGYYLIADVPEGNYVVMASATGYQDASQSVTVTGNSTTKVDFALTAPTEATTASIDSIAYTTSGGRNSDRHLSVTITVVDDLGNHVANASVSITLSHDSGTSWNGAGTTGTAGTVTFELKNAPSGCYETAVTNVTAEGLTWDGLTPANGFCK